MNLVPSNTLEVLLGQTPVGFLELDSGGLEQSRFSFSPAYRSMSRRPVLGQMFLDDLEGSWKARVRVPAFFSNLLPEGLLRELLASRAGINPAREFFLLAALGEDLPGNVIVRPLGALQPDAVLSLELPADTVGTHEPLRFSVAGLQLKFSVIRQGNGWRLPFRGQGGRWLLKLPSERFPLVPRNEYWTMTFARELGLDVADVELVRLEQIEGLLEEVRIPNHEEEALLVRRFDRTEGPERIHVEDFLQMLDQFPESRTKYRAGNYDQFGRVLRALVGDEIVGEYLRRIVFNAALGNGDAHLKNWMLRYPDGVTATLSPAFDLVSTIQYLDTDQHEFALNFAKTKRYDELSIQKVERFAAAIRVPGRDDPNPLSLIEIAVDMASRIARDWPAFAERHAVPKEFTQRLHEHWKRIPLMSGRR